MIGILFTRFVDLKVALAGGVIAGAISYYIGHRNGHNRGSLDGHRLCEHNMRCEDAAIDARQRNLNIRIDHNWALSNVYSEVQSRIHAQWDIESYYDKSERVPDELYNEILRLMLERSDHYARRIESRFHNYCHIRGHIAETMVLNMIERIVDYETNHPNESNTTSSFVPPKYIQE